jgi:hypothetical protein
VAHHKGNRCRRGLFRSNKQVAIGSAGLLPFLVEDSFGKISLHDITVAQITSCAAHSSSNNSVAIRPGAVSARAAAICGTSFANWSPTTRVSGFSQTN